MAGQLTLMLGALACAAVLAAGKPSLADGANEEDCRKFHQDCSDARAQGARRHVQRRTTRVHHRPRG